MLRKTFIRLILVIAVATTSLIVFAATREIAEKEAEGKERCENMKECEPSGAKNGYMILETFGRVLLSTSR